MKKLLFLFLILFFFFSCGRGKAPISESSRIIPDSFAIGLNLYNKGRAVYHHSNNMDSMLFYMQLAEGFFIRDGHKAQVNRYIASVYSARGESDEAIRYFLRASRTAEEWQYSFICQGIADAYTAAGRFREGVSGLDSIRKNMDNRQMVPYYHLAKGNLWAGINEYDSASTYYRIASMSLNRWVAAEASRRLKLLYSSLGKDSCSFYSALAANEHLVNELRREEGVESRTKYEKAKLENELNRLKIDKQRREIWLLSLGLCFVVAFAASYIVWQRRKRQMYKQLWREQSLRLSQTEQLLQQSEELSILREKESQLRESLFRRMKSFHKIPSLEKEEESAEEENDNQNRRIALSNEEWEDIRQTVDGSYDNFSARLLEAFPGLSMKDVYFCCLVKINVSIKDLSDIYCISRTSISRKKQRMKRDKLGLTENNETLDDFLRRF